MTRIAVTKTDFNKARAVFEAAARTGLHCFCAPDDEAGLAAAIREHNAHHAVVGVVAYVDALYEALPKGGVIARFGVGHDGIDKVLATKHGLLCTNTPGVLDDSVAEHCMALVLAAARHVAELAPRVRADDWEPRVGFELKGKTLAVIGCGAIGCRIARIAAHGFGMQVMGNEIRDVDADALCETYGFTAITPDFSEAVAAADVVSLVIPSVPATRHFINAERLSSIKRGAWLVNTARGAVVCEDDLYDAIADGHLAGAALDVMEAEPYVPQSPDKDLRSLPSCLMTPHIASSTQEACDRMATMALENIQHAEAGNHAAMALIG